MIDLMIISLCLIGSAFYSGIETGVVSIHPLRLRHMLRSKHPSAPIVQHFTDQPDHLLGTTLTGTNICNVITSVATAGLFLTVFPEHSGLISTVTVTLTLLVFGEYLPKAWFRSRPWKRTALFAKPLKYSGYLLLPISTFATYIAKAITPFGGIPEEEEPLLTREELKLLAHQTKSTGELKEHEYQMIQRVIDLSSRPCCQIMTPASEILNLALNNNTDQIIETGRRNHKSRYPVIHPDTRTYVGTLSLLDVLNDNERGDKTAAHYIRPPQFITEDTPVSRLLARMQRSHQPVLLVKNNQDTVTGMITAQDVIAGIMGDQHAQQ